MHARLQLLQPSHLAASIMILFITALLYVQRPSLFLNDLLQNVGALLRVGRLRFCGVFFGFAFAGSVSKNRVCLSTAEKKLSTIPRQNQAKWAKFSVLSRISLFHLNRSYRILSCLTLSCPSVSPARSSDSFCPEAHHCHYSCARSACHDDHDHDRCRVSCLYCFHSRASCCACIS